MVSKALMSRKNLTALVLICAIVLIPAVCAQVEMLVIQLGFTALRMGATLVTQMKNREGINYDAINRKNKHTDPIHDAWGYSKPTKSAEHAEKEVSKPHDDSAKDVEATAKTGEDTAVKSVHGSIVDSTMEETAKEVAPEEVAAKEKVAKEEVVREAAAKKVAIRKVAAKEVQREVQSEKSAASTGDAGAKQRNASSAPSPYLMMNVSD